MPAAVELTMRPPVLAVWLVIAVGCYRPPSSRAPVGVSNDVYSALELGASQALACAAEDLGYQPLGDGRHLFRGCGGEVEMLPALVAHTAVAFPGPANAYARERGCELTRTTDQRIDARSRVVDGCGARVVYAFSCEDPPRGETIATCGWTRSDDAPAPEAKPPFASRASNRNRVVIANRDALTVEASSSFVGYGPSNVIDGEPQTAWYSANDDSAAKGGGPWVLLKFEHPVTVGRVTVVASRDPSFPTGYSVRSGRVELLDEVGTVLVVLTGPGEESELHDHDYELREPAHGVKGVRFTSILDDGDDNPYGDIAIGEVQVD